MKTPEEMKKFFAERDRKIDRTIAKTYSDEYREWLHGDRRAPAPHPWTRRPRRLIERDQR
jgi:hypothetical protein